MAAPRVVAALVAVAVAFAAGCSAPAPPPAAPVIEQYRAAVLAEADAFHSATRTLTDAVRAGDVAAAKAAYQPAHRLYVALDDGVAILNSSTGQELTAVPFQGIESILHVGTLNT